MIEEAGDVKSTDGMPVLSPVEAVDRDFSLISEFNITRTDALGQQQSDDMSETREVEFLGFRVADLHLLCPFERVAEVSSVPPVYRVPNLPAWITGAASLRGEIVPVIDLNRYLGMTARPEMPMLVVVGRGDDRAGILVDDRPDIYSFSSRHQLPGDPPMHDELNAHLEAAYQKDGVIWLEIDLPALIDRMTG